MPSGGGERQHCRDQEVLERHIRIDVETGIEPRVEGDPVGGTGQHAVGLGERGQLDADPTGLTRRRDRQEEGQRQGACEPDPPALRGTAQDRGSQTTRLQHVAFH